MFLNQAAPKLINHFTLTLLVGMSFLSNVPAQSGFKKLMQIENLDYINIDDIQYKDHQLILRGNVYIDSVHLWGLFVAGLDTNGIVQWYNTIYDTSRQSHIVTNTPSKFILSKNKRLIIPSYYFNLHNIVLFITDSIGNQLYSNEYENSERTIFPMDILEYFDNYYIVGFIQRLNYLIDVFIIKTDSTGKFIWKKYYGTPLNNESFGGVIQNKDGSMTISSDAYTSDYSDIDALQGYKKPWIFTVDTSGAIIKQWQGVENDSRTLGGGPFYHIHDKDWIICSYDRKKFLVSEFISEFRYTPTITRLDSNYNLIWKINLTDYTDLDVRLIDLEYDTIQDEIILVGNYTSYSSPTSAESYIWSLKLDPSGDILWNKKDTITTYTADSEYNTAGVVMSPSGSIYVSGFVVIHSDHTLEKGWLIKLTPDGCADTICTTTSIADQIRQKDNKIILYPNPAKDELNISIQDLTGAGEILMYDVYGRTVLRKEVYNGNNSIQLHLPADIYFCSVFNNSKLIYSHKILITH